VLLIFESLIIAFEDARERHLLVESLNSQISEQASDSPSAPSSLSTTTTPTPKRTTRSSQSIPIPRISASTESSAANIAPVTAEEQTTTLTNAQTDSKLESEKHFATNINLA
jgi:hypothetical protein